LRLSKQWQPVLTYGDLTRLDPATVTPQNVFEEVCHMRTSKLPDPKVNGNAGSFFKNPVVSAEQAAALLEKSQSSHYPQPDGTVKLAAGWLIDQCQLKGVSIGGAAVHPLQALVLINQNHATSKMLSAWLTMYVNRLARSLMSGWSRRCVLSAIVAKSMPWR
jgi:UDP-N-acetylmuramate dehydrogenase